MHPMLVKAREIRIAEDRRAAELADRKARNADEALARQKLVVDAINEAFGGARVVRRSEAPSVGLRAHPTRLAAEACAANEYVYIRFGPDIRHRIAIEQHPTKPGLRYRIDGLGARVYDAIPELMDGLAEILAPSLDLSEPDERPYHLTPAEAAAIREILTAFRPGKERHPDVDVAALLKKLEA